MLAHLFSALLAELATGWMLLAIIAALLTMQYWLGPVLIRFTNRTHADPRLEPFEPDADRVPSAVRAHIERVTQSLAGEGFVPAADLMMHTTTGNVTSRVRFFDNPATDESAVATGAYTHAGELGMMVMVTEFSTDFRDGTTRQTNDSPIVGVYARRPHRRVEQLPGVSDAAVLCRVHRALVRRDGARVAPSSYRADPARALARDVVRVLDEQVACGYLWKDAAAGAYRPTWKGAWLMTWKLLQPMKALRLRLIRRRAERLLRDLGGGAGPHQPNTSEAAASPRSVTTAQSGHAFASSR